LMYSIRSHL